MKQVILITLLMLSVYCIAYGQENDHTGIVFDTVTYDFGLLKKGSDATYRFSFVNRSETPVILTNVKSSCGCTVPEWPRAPFKPGESGTIKVKYNTRITGTFQKTIHVHTSQNSQPIVLTIKGVVKKIKKQK